MDSSPVPTDFDTALAPPPLDPREPLAFTAPVSLPPLASTSSANSLAVPLATENWAQQNQLAQVRLGQASSLFVALRARHEGTAAHCLRVALGCSSWGQQLRMSEPHLDELEVGALLHDVGKLGIPDHVLLKTGPLTHEDRVALTQRHAVAEQVLLSCCASQNVMNIVRYSTAWYDGSRPGFDREGQNLPLGARMVAIVDAYDSITSDHTYRRGLTSAGALAEMLSCAGTQFDAELVELFCDLVSSHQFGATANVARRWLHELSAEKSHRLLQVGNLSEEASGSDADLDELFHINLLDSMHDGVVFVDRDQRILAWNRAAEQLTGYTAADMLHRKWSQTLIDLRDQHAGELTEDQAPLTSALSGHAQAPRRMTIRSAEQKRLSVEVYAVPVIGQDGELRGATLMLHDASSQINLEQRVETLHVQATRDPLTRISNRAEFDRAHAEFVSNSQKSGRPCALIICDIDHFKLVNDTYGHQAGDHVLIRFAALLDRSCRQGDLVARYGGEEFVVLCADCDNATVTMRAEAIRRELESTPQACLEHRPITASFGVTEIQAGDTPETMLRRADRALLQAKGSGRNRVVQLGSGAMLFGKEKPLGRWRRWLQSPPSQSLLAETLVTAAPLAVTMEKLRGFVSDHHAEIVATEDGKLQLLITKQAVACQATTDRPVSFLVTLQFLERKIDQKPRADSTHTIIHVTMQLANNRDRRRGNAFERARQLFASLKSYFMAQNYAGIFDPREAHANPTLFRRLLAMLHLGIGKSSRR